MRYLLVSLLSLLCLGCARQAGLTPPAPTPLPSPTAALAPTPTLAPAALSLSIGDPATPELGSAAYDMVRYSLRLKLDPAHPFIEGRASLQLQNPGPTPLHQLALDLVGLQVTALTSDDAPLAWQQQNDKLLITLPALLPAGAMTTLVVDYQGEPLRRPSPYNHLVDGLGLHFSPDGRIFAVNQPDGARYWFPCNDHPRDKALFRFEIVVPPDQMAIANGRLKATQALPDGLLYVWEHDAPMAPYLTTVVVGQYATWDQATAGGLTMHHYVWPDSLESFQAAAATLPEALDWLSARLGAYPFESLGFVTAPLLHLSLETQGLVTLSEADVRPATLVHELAHMWFGDAVSLDSWDEMWRNEGFATYLEALWSTRADPAGLEQRVAFWQAELAQRGGYPLGQIPATRLLHIENYYEGALFVHALHEAMGDEAFYAGLRLYLTRYAYQSASDAEFRAAMEEASGRSLAGVWDAWFAPPASR